MNYLNLDQPKESEETKEKKKTSPTAMGFLACSFASAAFALIAGVGNMPFLFVTSTAAAITFAIVFFIDDSTPDREEPVQPTYEELHDPEDCTDRSDNIVPPFRLNPTLGWTCSYCGVTNVWNPKHQGAVYCTHCGAKYENDELKTL